MELLILGFFSFLFYRYLVQPALQTAQGPYDSRAEKMQGFMDILQRYAKEQQGDQQRVEEMYRAKEQRKAKIWEREEGEYIPFEEL